MVSLGYAEKSLIFLARFLFSYTKVKVQTYHKPGLSVEPMFDPIIYGN